MNYSFIVYATNKRLSIKECGSVERGVTLPHRLKGYAVETTSLPRQRIYFYHVTGLVPPRILVYNRIRQVKNMRTFLLAELEDASVKYDMPLSPLDGLGKQYVQYALASLGVRTEG